MQLAVDLVLPGFCKASRSSPWRAAQVELLLAVSSRYAPPRVPPEVPSEVPLVPPALRGPVPGRDHKVANKYTGLYARERGPAGRARV